ncbi:acyltransferase family protein [Spirosoma sp. HMF4905]|uniref:Acyltransferase family protein n=1 Tax=Spirosoma arboris TaxID=2682092 RepID=A0A7K1SC00_9BACT|nr:acyltransferase family protein [Spirosoma arboris]MVM31319.1 acyltransferase family protein [Spirosoma arboris]
MLTVNQRQPVSISPIESPRFHALDAARTIALLIGIVHHGIESFVSYANGDWATQDSQSSIVLDIVFYVSHVFRMQAFFLMSGFFAHLLYHRRGPREFIINRTKRLLLPFLLFWPILYAINWHIWVWGIQRVKHLPWQESITKLPAYFNWDNGFPLMHLWFLYFLVLFCAGVAVVRPIVNGWLDPTKRLRAMVDKSLAFALTHWWGSLALGFIMIAPMLGMTDWFGVDTSASGLVPRWAPFILYGLYFTLGWFLHRQVHLLAYFRQFRLINLILSICLIAALIILSLLFDEPKNPADGRLILAGLNTLYAFASMTTVWAFIGYIMAHFSKSNPRIRYLADLAYWGYLVHLSIVALVQVLVAPYDWAWPLKLLLILSITSVLLGVTYQFGVRNTWLGVLLNGKRHSR